MSQENGPRRPSRTYLTRAALILLMVLGSVTLWIGSPLFWLWVTSGLQGTQAKMGPYALMLIGVIASSVAIAKSLSALNRAYARISETGGVVQIHLPWHRMRGAEHESRVRPVTVLDVVMILSVLVAGSLLLAWFLLVNPSPPGLEPGGFKN